MLTLIVGILTIILMIVLAVLGLIVTIPAFIIDIILLSPVWIPLLIAGIIVLTIFLVKRRQILRKLRRGSSFAKLKNEGTSANSAKEIEAKYTEVEFEAEEAEEEEEAEAESTIEA